MKQHNFLKVFIGAMLFAGVCLAANTPIEDYLKYDSASLYTIGRRESPYLHLQRLVKKLRDDIQTDPSVSDQAYLEIGDAYHWLGHIEEERGEKTAAMKWYVLSMESYDKSAIANSPRINNLVGYDHAEKHVLMIKHGSSLIDYYSDGQNSLLLPHQLPPSFEAYIKTLACIHETRVLKLIIEQDECGDFFLELVNPPPRRPRPKKN